MDKTKKLLLIFACLVFVKETKATKFLSAERRGIAKMTFTCKFSMRRWKNVTWLLNGRSTNGYPHFQVTNKHLPNRHVLSTTLKVIRPEITNMGDTYTCVVDGHKHKFRYIEGLKSVFNGSGWYYFSENAHSIDFHVSTVTEICKIWNATLVVERSRCFGWGCYCKNIKVFDVMSTVTNETKIKPIPFFSFKIDDYVNLPENYNNSFHFFCGNMDDPTKVYDNVRRKHVTFISRKFKPEKSCYIKIYGNHPFRDEHYDQFGFSDLTVWKELIIKSTSLKPGIPTITSAVLRNGKCEIIIKFPDNVDVKDTYEHFKPQILVNGEITEKFLRLSDHIFEIVVNGRIESIISARVLSTAKKYNSELSNSIKCV